MLGSHFFKKSHFSFWYCQILCELFSKGEIKNFVCTKVQLAGPIKGSSSCMKGRLHLGRLGTVYSSVTSEDTSRAQIQTSSSGTGSYTNTGICFCKQLTPKQHFESDCFRVNLTLHSCSTVVSTVPLQWKSPGSEAHLNSVRKRLPYCVRWTSSCYATRAAQSH